jgi:uncharacterized protein
MTITRKTPTGELSVGFLSPLLHPLPEQVLCLDEFVNEGVAVFHTGTERDLGVFACRDFARGECVMKGNGKIIHEQTEHSIQIDWNLHLEVHAPVRFLNHSCDPNLGVRTNPSGLPDFYAMRDISAGTELTFDYAMTEYTHYPRANPALDFDLSCACGSQSCRGRLGYFSELPPEIKEKYRGLVSTYLLEEGK